MTTYGDNCPRLRENVTNTWQLIVKGDEFKALVDGRRVLEVDMDPYNNGSRVTLTVYERREGIAARVRFNNLGVWQP